MSILKVTHNAGIFSCCSVALHQLMRYFNENKAVPEVFDRSKQFSFYKINEADNIVPLLFEENSMEIPFIRRVAIPFALYDAQHSRYEAKEINDAQPFIEKYFSASQLVSNIIKGYEVRYNIDYSNTCAVHYRGNDRRGNAPTATYAEFISKCREVKQKKPDMRFFLLTDEKEFENEFLNEFPASFMLYEVPSMESQNTFYPMNKDIQERQPFASYFLAAIMTVAMCDTVVTHSGNCSIWELLYRGNNINFNQFYIDRWI